MLLSFIPSFFINDLFVCEFREVGGGIGDPTPPENSIYILFLKNVHSRLPKNCLGPPGKLKYPSEPPPPTFPFPDFFSESAHIVELNTYTADYFFSFII